MDGGSGGPATAGGGAHPRLRRGGGGADECEAVKAIDGWARNALIPDESFFQVTKR